MANVFSTLANRCLLDLVFLSSVQSLRKQFSHLHYDLFVIITLKLVAAQIYQRP